MARPGAPIHIPSVPNLRDLGGWPTRDGRTVRRGVLFRSAQPTDLSEADGQALAGLRLRRIIDLRSAAERAARPDPVLPGVRNRAIDVLGDTRGATPARLLELLDNPREATEALGGDRGTALLAQAYRDLVSLPSARTGYGQALRDLLDQGNRPALLHCTTGKDRTGWAAAVILSLLGVPREDIMAEYLLTNEQLRPALQPIFDAFETEGGDPDVLEPVFGVRPLYLETAFAQMASQYETVEGYLARGLSIGPMDQEALRGALLVA